MRVLPHQLDRQGFRLRYGILLDVLIPYQDIERIDQVKHQEPGMGQEGLKVDAGERTARIRVGGAVNLRLALRRPLRLRTLSGWSAPVEAIAFWADAPGRLRQELQERLLSADRSGSLTARQ